VYRADRAFLRKLKELDPLLTVVWDTQAQKWFIYRNQAYGRAIPVKVVQGRDRKYRPLDNRVIKELNHGDTWKRRRKILREFEDIDFQKNEGWKKDFEEETDYEAKHYVKHLMNEKVGWTPALEKA